MFSRDFRAWARERLSGYWGAAVGVAFVGSLLGGGVDALSGAIEVSYEGEIGLVEAIPREVWAMSSHEMEPSAPRSHRSPMA